MDLKKAYLFRKHFDIFLNLWYSSFMGKIDEKKEFIGALKFYLSVVVAVILAVGAGISKLYLSGNIGILFWSGFFIILVMFFLFAFFSKQMHKEIKDLKDL